MEFEIEDLRIDIEEHSDWVVAKVKGEISLKTIAYAKQQLKILAGYPQPTIILDMSGLEYIDSSGLGTLVSQHQILRDQNKNLKVANLRERTRSIFHAIALDKVLCLEDFIPTAT